MKGNLFLNSDDQKFNFGLVFFGPPGKMETQKIVNLLNDTDNESSKFATKKMVYHL